VANTVPFNISWSSVGRSNLHDSTCEDPVAGTPDYTLVFTAPQSGTYRFHAAGLVDSTPHENKNTDDGDSVMAIVRGSCPALNAAEAGCNDDVVRNENVDSQIDLALTAGQSVTVYLNELGEPHGGTGTLSITLQGS
jgi:hypothetical protein